MLIAISGSQGSGKTTLLNSLEQKGCRILHKKVSRSILEDWNVSLDEVNSNLELSLKFQGEVIKRKHDEERNAYVSPQLSFVERTFTDVFVYTLINFGKHNFHGDWLNEYYLKCLEYNQQYSYVWYLNGGLFPVEDDGVRGANHHYTRMVDILMKDYMKRMIHTSRLSFIDVQDMRDRIEIIYNQSKSLWMG